MLKDKMSQEITVNRSVYSCGEVLDACVANEIAMQCYRNLGSFNSYHSIGRLKDIDINKLVSLTISTFGLKEYSKNITDILFEAKEVTKFRLVNDEAFIFLDVDGKTPTEYEGEGITETDDGIYPEPSDDKKHNVWNIQFGSSTENCSKIAEFFKQYVTKVNAQRKGIFCMVEGHGRLELHHIGFPGQPLVRTNYSKKVLEGYERIISDLRTDKPSGSLSILSGAPGTGKTFAIRGIIDATEKDALFIMIPPSVVAGMSGPHMIPLLVDIKTYYLKDKTCVVFIVEDGDSILVKRGNDNMSSISTLLNCSDGILGTMFDMRILITTNANSLDFDPALTRPGRLSCRIEINELTKEESIVAYSTITGKSDGKNIIKKSMTLAEIYALANGNDYTFEEENKAIGF